MKQPARWVRAAAGRVLLRARLRRALPAPVAGVLAGLTAAGHVAYLVGGCVRDLLLGRTPADWDVCTGAAPEQVRSVFGHTVPFKHNTVLVIADRTPVQVTTLRGPDLAADLGGRDFTIGALAVDAAGRLHDPLGGWADLARGVVRGCSDAGARFDADPVRLVRAVRLAAQLQFRLDPATRAAIPARAPRLAEVAPERLRDELAKLLVSAWPAWGLEELRALGLLAYIVPELLESVGVEQNRYHAWPVWEHLLLATANAPPVLRLRLAALLHDVAKPRCLSVDEAGRRHFYGHELVGADMARAILERLRFDSATRDRVVHLVRCHMDLHLDLAMSDRAILRMVSRIGRENLTDLVALRRADYIANGTKSGELGSGTHFLLRRIAELEAEQQAFDRTDLAVGGTQVMAVLGLAPGPAVGEALAWLVDEVQAGRAANVAGELLDHLARWPGPGSGR